MDRLTARQRLALAAASLAGVALGAGLEFGWGWALILAGLAGLALVFNHALRDALERARPAAAASEEPGT